MLRRFTTVAAAVSCLAGSVLAQQNAFVGTWKFAPEKSTINDSRRLSQTLTLELYLGGLRSLSELVFEDGRKIVTEWTATLDGSPSSLVGDSHYDTISVERIDEQTLKVTSKKGASADRSSRWVISLDGKTMTKIQKVLNEHGALVDNIIVMEKQNPFVGTWKLVPEKSTINDVIRVSQTLVLEADGDGLRSRAELVYEDGRSIKTEWAAALDGTSSPLLGDAHYDAVSVKMLDDDTLEIVSIKGSVVARSSRWVISPDGRRMTKIQRVTNAQGVDVDNVIVMQKQPPRRNPR